MAEITEPEVTSTLEVLVMLAQWEVNLKILFKLKKKNDLEVHKVTKSREKMHNWWPLEDDEARK